MSLRRSLRALYRPFESSWSDFPRGLAASPCVHRAWDASASPGCSASVPSAPPHSPLRASPLPPLLRSHRAFSSHLRWRPAPAPRTVGSPPAHEAAASRGRRSLFGKAKNTPAARIEEPHAVSSPGVEAGGAPFSFVSDLLDATPAPFAWSPHSFTRTRRDPETEPPRFNLTRAELDRNLAHDPAHISPWRGVAPHSLELDSYFFTPRAVLSESHWSSKARRFLNLGWIPSIREKELSHYGAVSLHKAIVYQVRVRVDPVPPPGPGHPPSPYNV